MEPAINHSLGTSYTAMMMGSPIRPTLPVLIGIILLSATCFAWQSTAKPSAAIPMTASTLPATPPTAPPTTTVTVPSNPPRRATVTYSADLLQVTADNSSLNQILRDISRATGMKVTGGVGDERVFGVYGPMPTAKLLALLLNGTGSNMVFVQSTSASSPELILTARQGGPTPPNPNARGFDDSPGDGDPSPDQPPVAVRPLPPREENQLRAPNGVRSPQQIYDQLQRNRQQAPAPQ